MPRLNPLDLTPVEVRQILGISAATVRRWRKSGRLVAAKSGARWYYNRAVVDRYRELAELRRDLPPGCRFFLAEVVDKYYAAAHRKYRIIRRPRLAYWLTIRSDYLARHPASERPRFPKVKFYRRTFGLLGGGFIRLVAIAPKYFARLPAADRTRWREYEFD